MAKAYSMPIFVFPNMDGRTDRSMSRMVTMNIANMSEITSEMCPMKFQKRLYLARESISFRPHLVLIMMVGP